LQLSRTVKALQAGAFLELNHDPARSALVLGSGRSGTTWLAEALARHCASRLVFEPFHPLWSPGSDDLRLFLAPDDVDQGMVSLTDRALAGRMRKRQLDQIKVTRLSRSRIVKDIHSTNLLPWYARNYAEVPLVFTVRHPVATAVSRKRFGSFYGLAAYLETAGGRSDAEQSPVAQWLPAYDEHRAHPDDLVRLVAEWCIENAYPLSWSGQGRVALVFYETAVLDPVPELSRLAEFCGAALQPAGDADFGAESVRKPSAKDWFGTAADAARTRDWDQVVNRWTTEVPAATRSKCIEVLTDFGLDRFYGEDPMPLPKSTGATTSSDQSGAQ
jgi:hypothetical protein